MAKDGFGSGTPGSWTIARIRGISLRIHFSLIFLLVYVILVASAQFNMIAIRSGVDPAALTGGPLFWSLVFALALFVSIAAHEFGHALVAQSLGVRVPSITLMMLGGLSEIEEVPERPYAEFKLAVVGPLVSLGIAFALYLVRNNTTDANWIFFSGWIGGTNLVLAIFNLLPAFPLDGGRALRSLIAARRGMARATEISVRLSKGLAWALGILGVLSFNFLLVLIAFFIYTTGQRELSMLLSRMLLKGVSVRDALFPEPPIPDTLTIAEAASRMVSMRATALPVITARGVSGIVSVLRLSAVPKELWDSTPVSQVMHESRRTADINEPLSQVFTFLNTTPEGALIVTEYGKIVGLLRTQDVSELVALKSLERFHREDLAA